MLGRGAARRVRHGLGALAVLGLLAGCVGAGPAPTVDRGIQDALDRRAAAVLAQDVPEDDPAAKEFGNLRDVPLGSWSYRVLATQREGARASVRAEVGYTIDGYDSGAVTGERVLDLARRDGTWRVTGDRAAAGAAPRIWEQGRVEVVRGARSLVLGVGHDPAWLRDVAAVADRAVPAVAEAWPEPWAGRAVVLVPPSLEGMSALLGEPAASYRGIAAVTTGRVGGGAGDRAGDRADDRAGVSAGEGTGTSAEGQAGGAAGTPADRVVVNPEAYRTLGDFGQRFVLAHEIVHVATRAHTSVATPLWLSEGFADRVAYRGTGRTAAEGAPELGRAVRAGEPPAALPRDADFTFGGDAGTVARAYEGAWLACELIARRWGEDKLIAFYRAVGVSGAQRAFRDVLSTTPDDFTRDWREHLRQELSSSPSR
ncbi:hypothetical protein [Streptomyces sp. TRM49041]|uniref:hypothetical protein n=1 Tax=Streptomyces sp. TRM49041 TaxID=2603216 RepID=UPI0011EBC484|nr:hypothetical protein [Streptomyces sp. TRM49041]